MAEGQLRTTAPEVGEFFQGLNAARVVLEVGTHSAWIRDVLCSCGHEVLVANPRLMEGSKRRKRKNDSNFSADSSWGKAPRVLMILRSERCSASTLLVV